MIAVWVGAALAAARRLPSCGGGIFTAGTPCAADRGMSVQTVTARERAPEPRILLTGATGYIGGRLRVELERRGIPLRCLARHPEALRGRVRDSTEVAQGDASDEESVTRACHGVGILQ